VSNIKFEKYTLDNGLKVIIQEDMSTSMVAVNVAYDVGSRDESPDRTGFAHLFEHLMFSGSAHIKDFDTVIQDAGGESNAFTNADVTNFHVVLPVQNIETALWLESDRMVALNINKRSLKTQQKVVIEEFKETCLNEPFGDMWHHLSALCYTKHPYQWPTIGLDMNHIADATIEEVKAFYHKFYNPSQATIVVSGGIKAETLLSLVKKWFDDIEPSLDYSRSLPIEPTQTHARYQRIIDPNLPNDALYMAFPMCSRLDKRYHATDLLTDVLAEGRSSRFYKRLLKGMHLFSTIDAFISGSNDPGLLIIEAKMMPGVKPSAAMDVIWKEIDDVCNTQISDEELNKLKNNVESSIAFSDVNILNKALSLAYFELLGDASMINTEADRYNRVTSADIQAVAREIFDRDKVNVLVYEREE
jgi:zinc protease